VLVMVQVCHWHPRIPEWFIVPLSKLLYRMNLGGTCMRTPEPQRSQNPHTLSCNTLWWRNLPGHIIQLLKLWLTKNICQNQLLRLKNAKFLGQDLHLTHLQVVGVRSTDIPALIIVAWVDMESPLRVQALRKLGRTILHTFSGRILDTIQISIGLDVIGQVSTFVAIVLAALEASFMNPPQKCKYFTPQTRLQLNFWQSRCIAVKSSVLQGMFVCFNKEVGWCVGIAVILVVGREQ
jgi:hypothetical protein